MAMYILEEEFGDTKGVIKIRKSKKEQLFNKIMLAACIELRRKISLKHRTFPRMPFQSGFPLSDGKLDTDVGSSDMIELASLLIVNLLPRNL
jgi:hypothetical protein